MKRYVIALLLVFITSVCWAADTKITDLGQDTAPAQNDKVVTVDVSDAAMDAAGTDKYVLLSDFQRLKWGTNITGNGTLATVTQQQLIYQVTAACTVTLDAAADVGYGAVTGFYVRDAAETVIIELEAGEKINLHGTPLDGGDTIDSPGNAGDFIFLISTTDADGSGTDGYITMGYGHAVWTDGGAT